MRPENNFTILNGSVEISIVAVRTIFTDYAAINLSGTLVKQTGIDMARYTQHYSELVTYITEMNFNWKDSDPQEYRTLETWWNMTSNSLPADCYMYFGDNIPTDIVIELVNGKETAQQLMKPLVEKDSEDDASADPKSLKAKEISVTK